MLYSRRSMSIWFEVSSTWNMFYSDFCILAWKFAKLESHTKFHCVVSKAKWVSDHWEIDITEDGRTRTENFSFLIGGAGALHRPMIPKFPGLDKFKGEKWHSAEWRHDVPLEGEF